MTDVETKKSPGKPKRPSNQDVESETGRPEETAGQSNPGNARKEEDKKRTPKTCVNCGRWKEVKRQMGIARILGNAVKKFESKLGDAEFTPTVAEYLKLVQIEQEYEKELNPPEEIRVTWVEPTTESENSE